MLLQWVLCTQVWVRCCSGWCPLSRRCWSGKGLWRRVWTLRRGWGRSRLVFCFGRNFTLMFGCCCCCFLEEDGAAVGICVQWGCTVGVYSVGEEGAAQGLRTQRVWWGWAGACCLCVFFGVCFFFLGGGGKESGCCTEAEDLTGVFWLGIGVGEGGAADYMYICIEVGHELFLLVRPAFVMFLLCVVAARQRQHAMVPFQPWLWRDLHSGQPSAGCGRRPVGHTGWSSG